MTESIRTLRSGFLRSCEIFPDRPALEVQGEVLTFVNYGGEALPWPQS